MRLNQLDAFKKRYFRILMAGTGVYHLFDCDIYDANKPYCSCGLLHDLRAMNENLVQVLYPDYNNDLAIQHDASDDQFEEFKELTFTEQEYKEVKEFLDAVFPDYSDAYSRLDSLSS